MTSHSARREVSARATLVSIGTVDPEIRQAAVEDQLESRTQLSTNGHPGCEIFSEDSVLTCTTVAFDPGQTRCKVDESFK